MKSAGQQALDAELKLRAAIVEARGSIKDVHRAVKDHRDEIHAQVELEVAKQVTAILADVRATAEQRIITVIDEIRSDWRARLGLDAKA